MQIIYDWSGTLFDDTEAVFGRAMEVFRIFDTAPISLDEFRDSLCVPYIEFYRRYLGNVSQEDIDTAFQSTRPVSVPKLFSGAMNLLRFSARIAKKVTIVSMAPRAELEPLLTATGIEWHADVRDKEATIREILKSAAGSEPVLSIGDMVSDIEVARANGLSSIAVGWGHQSPARLKESKPNYFVQDFVELSRVLHAQTEDIFDRT
jgi:phosphoglycolate phosphatase-like HAD superfamily hydrolase